MGLTRLIKPLIMKSNDRYSKQKTSNGWALLLLIPLIILSSCQDKCEVERRFIHYQPLYQPMSEVRASFEVLEPKSMGIPGKIYYHNGFLLINEPNLGIHIIDNQDQPHRSLGALCPFRGILTWRYREACFTPTGIRIWWSLISPIQ